MKDMLSHQYKAWTAYKAGEEHVAAEIMEQHINEKQCVDVGDMRLVKFLEKHMKAHCVKAVRFCM